MSENAKYLGTLFVVILLVTIVAGIVVFYVGSALPSGAI